MKRSNVHTSTSNSLSKRTRSNEENEKGPPPDENVDLLRYDFEQFQKVIEGSDFAKKLSHSSNQDIVHRIVAETRNASAEDIEGRRKVIREIIRKRRALLNFRAYKQKETPLHQRNIHLDLIKFLIKKGAFVEAVMETLKFKFVHVAATYLNPEEFHELVAYLLEMGYSDLIKARDCNGLTPIHLAVYNMEVKKETILLLKDSEGLQFDLNGVDLKENNVLAFAVMGGRNEGYLNLLQELGALPVVNKMGYSILHHAAFFGNLDAIKLFGTEEHLYLEAPGGLTPVHVALCSGQRNIHDVVKLLLDRCKEYAILSDDGGCTPLGWAQYGPLKESIEPRTVELLKNQLADFKANLKQGKSDRGAAEVERDAIGEDNISPEFEPEIVDPHTGGRGGTVDISSETPSVGDTESERAESNGSESIQKCFKMKNMINGEALRVPLDDQANQDASTNASDRGEEPGTSVVDVDSPICNMEPETPQIDSEPEIDVLAVLPVATPAVVLTGATTYTNETIQDLVSNSLGCTREEVKLKKNAIAKILRCRPKLLNVKHGERERTPILCEKVHLELLEFMIAKGANVSARTRNNDETVLHLAARYLDPEKYHKLVIIVQKTNPEILKAVTFDYDYLALHIACYEMEVKKETLQVSQNSGVDLASRCYCERENALSLALKGGRTLKFLKTLLSLGLEPVPVETGFGDTLIHYAARHCSLDVLEFVIQLSPAKHVNVLKCHKKCPLEYAVSGGMITENHVEIANALLHKYELRQRLKKENMRNVIYCVAENSARCSPEEIDRRKQIIDLLIECDDKLLNERATPLKMPMVHVELLKYLICKGCDPRCQGFNGNTFLHLVREEQFSAEQYHDLIIFLIKNGYADVLKTRDGNRRTPLLHALQCIELKEETIEVYKTYGGLKQVDNQGRNIIYYAYLGRRSLDFMKMLMKKARMGVDDFEKCAPHIVAEDGDLDLDMLKYFLGLKPELINQNNYYGKTWSWNAADKTRRDWKTLSIMNQSI